MKSPVPPARAILAALLLAQTALLHAVEPDIVLADFEGPTYGDWKTEGTAFGDGPSATLPGQMPVDGFAGRACANSFHGGDGSTGRLTSPVFTVRRHFLSFLIGGGGFPGKTCMNLLVDGRVVRTATGPNTQPGGKETLAADSWDVAELAGREARLEIVDDATGGWGHINVDQIVLTDAPPPRLLANVQRTLRLEHPLLNLPVQPGAPMRKVRIEVGGQSVRELDLELAQSEPAYWVFTDVTPWLGQTATLEVDRLPENATGLKLAETSDRLKGADDLYAEALRPQFHFSSRRGWINDPNGLAFYRGEYHMFYQHSPFTWGGAAKYWGHAVSKDLLHWEELPTALAPDALGEMYSGGAAFDSANTSGLGRDGLPPLVLIYTAAGSWGQCLASTTDGRTVTKYAGNPVLRQITPGNRDPHIFWHEPTSRWILALYVALPNSPDTGRHPSPSDTIQLFASKDLKEWKYLSETPGYFECPDMFPLPLDGDAAQTRWILTAANSDYQVGTFDGTAFHPETPILKGQSGNGMYAAQTFANMPDGRRVQIGWGTMPAPGMPFNQQMDFPCELTLRTTAAGPRMYWQPIQELEKLRTNTQAIPAQAVAPGQNPLQGAHGSFLEVEAEIEPGSAAQFGFSFRGSEVVYDTGRQELSCHGRTAALPLENGAVRLRILVDRLSLEIFGQGGLVYMPISDQAGSQELRPAFFARGGAAQIRSLTVHELSSIWAARP